MSKTTKKQNLLIVSYYLPPTKTVAAVRIFNFHLEAQKHFNTVFSMTSSNRQLFPKDKYNFNDEKTTEVWTYDLRRFLNKKNSISPGLSTKTKSSRFAQFVSRLSYSFPFNLFLADGGLTYILGGYSKGKKLIWENNIEVVFSSYKPYSDHLICFLLKKWNPNLIWIADFRDLHIDEIRQNILFPKIQKWFNQWVLKKANVVTTVSNGLAINLKEFHGNVSVLRNAISSVEEEAQPISSYEKFTISYTGSIYPQLRTAELLFVVLQNLIALGKVEEHKIQIIYAGNEGDIWAKWVADYNLQNISTIYQTLPLKEAKAIQKKSHINLLLSWASANQQGVLTGKFYEYLKAQNPILVIINGEKDKEFEQIFEDLQAGLVAYHHPDFQKRMEHFILKYYAEWNATGSVSSGIQKEQLSDFRWDNQMNNFINFLEQQS